MVAEGRRDRIHSSLSEEHARAPPPSSSGSRSSYLTVFSAHSAFLHRFDGIEVDRNCYDVIGPPEAFRKVLRAPFPSVGSKRGIKKVCNFVRVIFARRERAKLDRRKYLKFRPLVRFDLRDKNLMFAFEKRVLFLIIIEIIYKCNVSRQLSKKRN